MSLRGFSVFLLMTSLVMLPLPSCRSVPSRSDGMTGRHLAEAGRSEGLAETALSDRADQPRRGPLVVLSIDGCRFDYLSDDRLPNLRAMMDQGAHVRQVNVTIPSMSAPGHVTLLTGTWSGTHGIVFNKFYDRELGFIKFFGGIPVSEQTSYLEAEPVWVSAEKAGLETAAVHWAATAGEYDGRRVDHVVPFDPSWSDEDRVAEGIRLLQNHELDLLLIYTTGVSPASYKYGPGSPQVMARLEELDSLVGQLRAALAGGRPAPQATLMVVSDHGFGTALTGEICASWVLDDAGIAYEFIVWGAIGHLFLTHPEDAPQVKALLEPLEGVREVLLQDEAGQLHLATPGRTGDLLIVAQPGWQVANMWRPCDGPVVEVEPGYEKAGTHGLPSTEFPEMRAIFVAAGPNVRPVKLELASQLDVAPTISALLGIPPPVQAEGKALDILLDSQGP